jgi:hypothetical protein
VLADAARTIGTAESRVRRVQQVLLVHQVRRVHQVHQVHWCLESFVAFGTVDADWHERLCFGDTA